jgi:hypothetical protein
MAPGYVLGALDPAEMAAVREHLAGCSMPHPELGEMGGVLTYLGASLEPVEPPRHLRAAILAAVQADMAARYATEARPAAATTAPARIVPAESPELAVVGRTGSDKVISLRAARARRAAGWLVRIAAVVAIVASLGYSVSVQNDLNKAHQSQTQSDQFWHDATQDGAHTAVLVPAAGQKSAGNALLQLPRGQLELLLNNLAPTRGDEVYMVWWSADGGTLARGSWFTPDDQGKAVLQMDAVSPASSLWVMVCREPNKNVAKPGPAVATGTIWLFEPPAPTPTK